MTTTISGIVNNKRTVTIEFTADSAKVDTILESDARELHNRGQGPKDEEGDAVAWGDLTNPQKLAMVDAYIKQTLVNLAGAGNVRIQRDAARDAAQAENADNTFD